MTRLQVGLNQEEADALAEICKIELRDPRDQIRLIVREALKQRGVLRVDGEDAIAPSGVSINASAAAS